MGSVAAPALVVLGDGATGVVHVRFDDLGAVSLRGGCFRGNGDGDAGIRIRQLDDEGARRCCRRKVKWLVDGETENADGAKAPRLQGRTNRLRICAFECVSDAQQEMFIGNRADKLEPNGQTVRSEATGEGDGGDAG